MSCPISISKLNERIVQVQNDACLVSETNLFSFGRTQRIQKTNKIRMGKAVLSKTKAATRKRKWRKRGGEAQKQKERVARLARKRKQGPDVLKKQQRQWNRTYRQKLQEAQVQMAALVAPVNNGVGPVTAGAPAHASGLERNREAETSSGFDETSGTSIEEEWLKPEAPVVVEGTNCMEMPNTMKQETLCDKSTNEPEMVSKQDILDELARQEAESGLLSRKDSRLPASVARKLKPMFREVWRRKPHRNNIQEETAGVRTRQNTHVNLRSDAGSVGGPPKSVSGRQLRPRRTAPPLRWPEDKELDEIGGNHGNHMEMPAVQEMEHQRRLRAVQTSVKVKPAARIGKKTKRSRKKPGGKVPRKKLDTTKYREEDWQVSRILDWELRDGEEFYLTEWFAYQELEWVHRDNFSEACEEDLERLSRRPKHSGNPSASA